MEKYVPDMYFQNIYLVNYKKLKEQGIKCILFDLDNTIVPYNVYDPSKKVVELFLMLKKDFKVIIFSNSPKIRVRVFKEKLDVDFLANAKKPMSKNFKKILDEYKYEINEVAIIGDQLNTDIVGGNEVGITTVLVNPVSNKEIIFNRISRLKENRIIKKLNERDLFFKERYYE